MPELKPCPFCGSEAEVRIIYNELETTDVPRFSYVRCVRCFSQTAEYSFKNSDRTGIDPREASIKAWNRRIETPRTVTAK